MAHTTFVHCCLLLTLLAVWKSAPLLAEEPCVLASPEDVVCVKWRYPHPTECYKYIACNEKCVARQHPCQKYNGERLHFSNSTQNCQLPGTVPCAGEPQPTAPPTLPPGVSVQPPTPTTQATTTPTTSPLPGPTPAVFNAVRDSRLPGGVAVLPFTHLTINEGNLFDLATNKFTARQAGLYWLHWSVGMEEDTYVNVSLRGTARSPNILRQHVDFRGTPITTSRDELVLMAAGAEAWLDSDTSLYSDQYGVHTSFNGFLLDAFLDPVVAFMVGRSTSLVNVPYYTRIEFDLFHVDTEGMWSDYSHAYTVPVSGIWFLSVQAATYPQGTFQIFLAVNGGLYHTHGFTQKVAGPDAVTFSAAVNLERGNILYLECNYVSFANIHSLYSDSNYQTAFMGFLYSPRRVEPVAWSVQRWSLRVTGPMEPFYFDNYFGGAWDDASQSVTAPQAGVYYMQFSAAIFGYPCKLQLMLNGVAVADVHHTEQSGSYLFLTTSRAIILRLNQGDRLHIRLDSGYFVNGDIFADTKFSGFLLY